MTGETHINTGISCGMLLCPPQTVTEFILGTGMLVIGATISDIDASTSRAKKQAIKIRAYIIAAIVVMYIIGRQTGINLFFITASHLGNYPTVIVAIVTLLICAYGSKTKHRTFMHSILAGGLLSLCMGLMLGTTYATYFSIGFITHILLDLLNERPVSVLYPSEKKFALHLCKSSGLADKLIFAITGIAGCALLFARFSAL